MTEALGSSLPIIKTKAPRPEGLKDPTSAKIKEIFTQFSSKIQTMLKNAEDKALNIKLGSWITENLHVPGTASLLSAPFDFFYLVKYLFAACVHGDKESQIDFLLRLVVFPFGLLYRASSVVINLIEVLSFFKLACISRVNSYFIEVVKTLNIIGIFLSTIELAFESFSLFKTFKFYVKILNEKDQLQFIKDQYFSLDNKEEETIQALAAKKSSDVESLRKRFYKIKESSLMHRIRPKAVERLKQSFEQGAIDENTSKELTKIVETQLQKKLVLHAIGIVAIILGLISLVYLLLGAPALLTFVILSASIGLSITRLLLQKGLLDQEGWKFSISACLPPFVKKGAEKITEIAKQALTRFQDYLEEQKGLGIGVHQVTDHHYKTTNDFLS